MGLAVVGFKRNLWLVVGALAGHGVLDFFHDALLHNTGVPRGWPGFCPTFDPTAAALVDDNDDVALDEIETVLLKKAVQRCRGNLCAAARTLGITRPQLVYRLKTRGIGFENE